ncbi:MAG TPA: YerC/YecD family TrpR-related protein [Phycisphaerae bacterium]|nr:YerC/YecD family TrpR-related protein [Phycisphaerae bacterium]
MTRNPPADPLDELLHTVVRLRHAGEARRFFRDLLTDDELEMISRRWQVATMLADGRSYREIEEQTGMSSRTVARIARWYKEGPGGYRLALARSHKTATPRTRAETRRHDDPKQS